MTTNVETSTAQPKSPFDDRDQLPSQVGQDSSLLSIAAAVVGVLSYACTLLMANALEPAEYTDYAAGQMLVGIVGVIASALVPLPLATAVARHPRGSLGRKQGLAFAALVSLIAGVAAALIAGGIAAAFANVGVSLAVGASALVIFAVAPTLGWLQGELRFMRYAVISVAETAVRLAFSVIAVVLVWGTAGALVGFIVGGLVLLIAPVAFYRDLTWRPSILGERSRWLETGGIALAQCIVAILVGADVIVVALLDDGSNLGAGFQALATLAKGPIYVAAGTVLLAFPLLRSPGAPIQDILTASLRSFGQLALLASAVIATVPVGLVTLVLPDRYIDALDMMPWLAAAGLGYATLTVLATVLLALRQYRLCQLGLLLACIFVTAGMLVGWQIDGVPGLAAGSAIGSLLAAGTTAVIAFPMLPAGIVRMTVRGLVLTVLLLVVLWIARPQPILWTVIVGIVGISLVLRMRGGRPARHRIDRSTGGRAAERLRLRVLYLDWPAPGEPPYGAHEIHRRLATGHSLTVLARRHRGSSDFTRDGVRYVHLGLERRIAGLDRISYLFALPFAIKRYAPDLVASGDSLPRLLTGPRFTGVPTVRLPDNHHTFAAPADQRGAQPLSHVEEQDWALVADAHHSLFVTAAGLTASRELNNEVGA